MSERKEAAFLIKAGIEGLEGKRKKRRQLKMIVKCYVKLLKIYKLACMHAILPYSKHYTPVAMYKMHSIQSQNIIFVHFLFRMI